MQPDEADAAHLWDMLEAAREAIGFIEGITYQDFLASALVRRGVERNLEVIEEAALRVSNTFREAHPEIPWREIIGQRNILAHDYGNVVPERVWRVASDDLAQLAATLEALIPDTDLADQ